MGEDMCENAGPSFHTSVIKRNVTKGISDKSRVDKRIRNLVDKNMNIRMICCGEQCRSEIQLQKMHFYGHCTVSQFKDLPRKITWEFPILFWCDRHCLKNKMHTYCGRGNKCHQAMQSFTARSATRVRQCVYSHFERVGDVYSYNYTTVHTYAMFEAWKHHKYMLASSHVYEKNGCLADLCDIHYAGKGFPIMKESYSDDIKPIIVNMSSELGPRSSISICKYDKRVKKNQKRRKIDQSIHDTIEFAKYHVSLLIRKYRDMPITQLMNSFIDILEHNMPKYDENTHQLCYPQPGCSVFDWPLVVWTPDLFVDLGNSPDDDYRTHVLKAGIFEGFSILSHRKERKSALSTRREVREFDETMRVEWEEHLRKCREWEENPTVWVPSVLLDPTIHMPHGHFVFDDDTYLGYTSDEGEKAESFGS